MSPAITGRSSGPLYRSLPGGQGIARRAWVLVWPSAPVSGERPRSHVLLVVIANAAYPCTTRVDKPSQTATAAGRSMLEGSTRSCAGGRRSAGVAVPYSVSEDMTKPPGGFGVSDRALADDPELRLAYLGAVVEASNDAIVSKALDGTITSWNASAERIFGYRPEEILGKNIRTLIPADLQEEEDEILARIRAGEYIEHYETVRLAKDGRRLDVSLSISPIKSRGGEVIGASKIARDISARKVAEDQLLAATAKFESVFSQSGIFGGILDLDG